MPKPTSITVTYRIGIKRSLGDKTFSTAILEEEGSETWDVSDLDELAIERLESSIHGRLQTRLDARVEEQDKEWRDE